MKYKMCVMGMGLMALAGCGGGGGSDSTEDFERNGDGGLSAFEGTWIRTNDNYYTANGQTFKLRRQTIVVEQEGDQLRFTDCIEGTSAVATVDNNTVTFLSAGIPSLQVVNDATLQSTLDFGGAKTDVVLTKVSDETEYRIAELDLEVRVPAVVSNWDQVCVETVLQGSTLIKVKTVDNASAVSVGLNIVLSGAVSPGQYEFPSATQSLDGYLNSVLDVTLFNPTGTLIVTQSSTTDFLLDVEFENDVDNTLVPVDGSIYFDPVWFAND